MSTCHRHSDTNASNDNVAATDGRFPDETTPVRHRRFQRPFVDPDEVTQVLVGVRGPPLLGFARWVRHEQLRSAR